MKFFNYLKIAVIFMTFCIAFSCNDDENLDEIIEPETRLMSREATVINQNYTNNIINRGVSNNCMVIRFKDGLTETEKTDAFNCLRSSDLWFEGHVFRKIASNRLYQLWSYYRNSGPNDDKDDDGSDGDLIGDILKKNKLLNKKFNCDHSNILYYETVGNCSLPKDQEVDEDNNSNVFFQK